MTSTFSEVMSLQAGISAWLKVSTTPNQQLLLCYVMIFCFGYASCKVEQWGDIRLAKRPVNSRDVDLGIPSKIVGAHFGVAAL